MKKSLIALAVLGAFSGAAFAEGSVTLYGLIDMGVTHYTGLAQGNDKANNAAGSPTVSSTGLNSGVESGSRLGVKGTEDLGGGVSALFDIETGMCAAGLSQQQAVAGGSPESGGYCSGGGFMQRQSYVGLAGNFGTVMAGHMYTGPFLNEANTDPFGYGLTGNIGNLALAPARADQTAVYITPDMSGFTGAVAYVFAAGKGTVPTAGQPNVARAVNLNGQYANGPIVVGLNYTHVTNALANTAGVDDGKSDLWQLFGTYDFGVAKLAALYEKQANDYTNLYPNKKFFMVGVTVPVGPGAILASYDHLDNGMADGTAKQFAVGYTYSLSKQTNLYASYAHTSNGADSAMAVGASNDYNNGVMGQSSSGMAVGIRHKF